MHMTSSFSRKASNPDCWLMLVIETSLLRVPGAEEPGPLLLVMLLLAAAVERITDFVE